MQRLMIPIGVLLCTLAFSPLARATDSVLILGGTTGSDANETAAQNALLAGGHTTVTIGSSISTFDGTGLTGYNAVVLLDGDLTTGGYQMPAAGQSALLNFVNNGGGLVTGEWANWSNAFYSNMSTLAVAFPVVPTTVFDYASPLTYSRLVPNSILDNGTPSSFTFAADNDGGTENQFAPKPGATAFFASSGGDSSDGLIGEAYGSGSVFSFSTLIGSSELTDPNYAQLFSNSVYAAESPVPEPATLGLLGIASAALLTRRRAHVIRVG
jgi:hypothetical protein